MAGDGARRRHQRRVTTARFCEATTSDGRSFLGGDEEDSEFLSLCLSLSLLCFLTAFDSPAAIPLSISLIDVSPIYSTKEAIRNNKPVTRTESSLCELVSHK